MNGEANPLAVFVCAEKTRLDLLGVKQRRNRFPCYDPFSKVNCRVFKNNDLYIRPVLWGTIARLHKASFTAVQAAQKWRTSIS